MIDYTAFTPLVQRVARAAHGSFPEHHSVSDTEQTLFVWLLQNRNTVDRITRETGGRPEGILYDLMFRAASDYLKGEDAQVYGYHRDDVFYYSTDLIKKILELVFRYEDWQSFAIALDAMPKGKSDPAHSGDNLASYADVKSACEKLSEDHYNAVVWRYKFLYTYDQIGAAAGVTKQAARLRLEGAVKAIQKALGQRPLSELRSGYESRSEPHTTASALARTERDYNG